MNSEFRGTVLELLDDELRKLFVSPTPVVRLAAGTSLRVAGTPCATLDVLLRGSVFVRDAQGATHTLRAPAELGLRELLWNAANQHDAQVSEPSEILRVPAQVVLKALREFPNLGQYLRKLGASEALKRFDRALRHFGVAPRAIWELIAEAGSEKRRAGQAIVSEGKTTPSAFIVHGGRVTGWKNVNGNDVLVSELGLGEVFGVEQAWKGQAMPATYRAGSDEALLLTLAPSVLQRVANADAAFRAFLESRGVGRAESEPLESAGAPEDEPGDDEDATPLEQFLIAESPAPRRRPRFKVLKQYDQMDCGAACLAMVAQAWGRKLGVSSYRAIVHVTREGASLWSMLQAARRTGFEATGVALGLDSLSEVRLPAILLTEYHFVVLYKVTPREVWLGDPSRSNLRKVPLEEFAAEWSGMALLMRPTPALYQVPESRAAYGKYLQIFKRSGRQLAEVFAATLLLAGVGLAGPMFTQIIFDKVFVGRDPSVLTLLVLGMASVAVFQIALTASRGLLFGHLTSKLDLVFSALFYKHVLRLPLSFFMARRVGDVLNRLGELVAIREFLTGNAISVLIDAARILLYFGAVLLYSPKLAAVLMVTIPAITVVTRRLSSRLRDRHQELFSLHGKLQGTVAEQFRALETIKSLNAEVPARWRWEVHLRRALKTQLDVETLNVVIGSSNAFLEKFALTAVLYLAARLVLRGEITVGQAMAASQLASATLSPINSLSTQWSKLQRVAVSFGRVEDTFTASTETGLSRVGSSSAPKAAPAEVRGTIEFNDVWFQYGPDDSAWVLRGLNLSIPAGQTVALVGRSGSGKTTLAQMVNLLYRPTRGSVLIDGRDATALPLDALRNSVGIVMQDNQLFAGSILDNITFGDLQPSAEKAMEAARVANAHDFIAVLKDGYRTILGEGGSGLSGGQKQRINIARALYRKPPILVLDEATSSLDSESERAVVEGMKRFCRGRTSIIIAHRLSTILYAERVVLLDQGRVIEQGTHQELIRKGGAYARLFGAQLAV